MPIRFVVNAAEGACWVEGDRYSRDRQTARLVSAERDGYVAYTLRRVERGSFDGGSPCQSHSFRMLPTGLLELARSMFT